MTDLLQVKFSKVQLEERKKSWETIQLALEFSGLFHTKAELKIFQSYYLRGTQPKLYPLYKDPIPLVYRLWLCPDQSIESWRAITEQLLAGPTAWKLGVSLEPVEGDEGDSWRAQCRGRIGDWQIQKSLDESRTILLQEANSYFYDGITTRVGSPLVAPLGFMGGAESKVLGFLAAAPGSDNYYEYNGRGLFDCAGCAGDYYYKFICVWLDARRPHNPYMISYYMCDHWYAALSDDYMRKLKSEWGAIFYLECYLQLLARYPKPEAGFESSERHLYCQKLRNILDNRPIPAELKALWLAAKDYKGLIDLNGLEFKYPSVEHPEYQPEHYYVGDF